MLNEDSFQYAIESMVVVRAPQQRIETFGNTSFRFYLVTELMDSAHQVRVREGYLHIERPQIVTPGFIRRSLLEGFGERAEEFVGWLQENARDLAIVKYGFQFRKTAVVEELIQSPLATVISRLEERVEQEENPFSAIIQGVDEGWEVCLLKFAVDLIQQSSGQHFEDFRKRGLL